ncbi:MAG: glycosyltransferase family 4 protein [Planctomycetota bacterium]|jgi:glycosyltransferase involved in cell wall biosynthesis
MDAANKKIHVCFISPKAYPIFNPQVESVFGGAEVDTYMIATELAKDENFEVSFIVADYGQPQEEVRENVRILKSLNFKQIPLTGACKIWKALKQANADVYMMKTASPGVPLVQYFCRKYNKRFIYKTAHQRECDGSYLQQHAVLGKLFVRSLKHADTVIAQNESDSENLRELFGIHSITISNAHHIKDLGDVERQSVLWVGRSAEFKHPERFLDLAIQFPQEPFMMICQRATGDTQYDALKADAAGIDNLTFIERVPFHEIDAYFEQAKVFVNTSDSEGFPNTFIQACKAGTAILSYAVNPDDFLDKHQCGISCNSNKQHFTGQLRYMLDNNRYLNLGCHGIKYVKDTHDITIILRQYIDIFKKESRR